jgi:hypothetical protein
VNVVPALSRGGSIDKMQFSKDRSRKCELQTLASDRG